MKRLFFLCIGFSFISIGTIPADDAVDIVAVTRSGKKITIESVPEDAIAVLIGPAGINLSMDDPVTDIEGLEKLPYLTDLTIVIMPQIVSFDFIGETPRLNRLVITDCKIGDFDFLKSLSELRVLIFELCRAPDGTSLLSDGTVDLTNNGKLEELYLVLCGLEKLPSIQGVSPSLRVLDLSYNPLSIGVADIPALREIQFVKEIRTRGIEIEKAVRELFGNLSL